MDETLTKRIEVLETEVSGLKTAIERRAAPKDWQSTVGRFRDSEHYDEALRLGQSWRKRQRKDGGRGADPRHGSPERVGSPERARRRITT